MQCVYIVGLGNSEEASWFEGKFCPIRAEEEQLYTAFNCRAEVGGTCALFAGEVSEQGDGHDGFAEAHLVGKDAVQAASVDGDQPFQPHVLILPQRSLQQEWYLDTPRIFPLSHVPFPTHQSHGESTFHDLISSPNIY